MKPLLRLLSLMALAACAAIDRDASPPDFDGDWNYRDPAATEARFRELAAAHPGAGLGWRAELETQIARTYSLRGEFERAHATLDAIQDQVGEAGAVARARYLLERGRTHNSAGEKERATELFRDAFEVADAVGAEFHAADALHMLGISTPPEEALAWNERAIEYCESCTDARARRWLGALYQNTWYTYLERGELDRALAFAEKGRAYRAAIGDADGERVSRWTIAHTWRKQGRVEEALAAFEALSVDYGAAGDPSGYTQEELGECLLALGRGEEAQPHFAEAYAILRRDPWLVDNEPARLARLAELAEEPE